MLSEAPTTLLGRSTPVTVSLRSRAGDQTPDTLVIRIKSKATTYLTKLRVIGHLDLTSDIYRLPQERSKMKRAYPPFLQPLILNRTPSPRPSDAEPVTKHPKP